MCRLTTIAQIGVTVSDHPVVQHTTQAHLCFEQCRPDCCLLFHNNINMDVSEAIKALQAISEDLVVLPGADEYN